MAKTYLTVQGDMWDTIAKKMLGSEFYLDKLMEANTQHADKVIFGANVQLIVPDVAPVIPAAKLPPWKRG